MRTRSSSRSSSQSKGRAETGGGKPGRCSKPSEGGLKGKECEGCEWCQEREEGGEERAVQETMGMILTALHDPESVEVTKRVQKAMMPL